MRKKYSKSIFHYTTMDGLYGILKTNCLYATNAFFLNDLSEVVHMKAFFKDLISSKFERHVISQLGEADKIKCDAFAAAIANMLFDMMIRELEPFVVCFCKANNDFIFRDGILSQWRGYGAGGGAAIEFDYGRFRKAVMQNNEEKSGIHLMLARVSYSRGKAFEEVKKMSERVTTAALTSLFTHIDRFRDKKPGFPISDQAVSDFMKEAWPSLTELMIRIAIVSCFAKDHSFFEEREVRLLGFAESQIDRHHHIRDGVFVPFTKLTIGDKLQGLIKRVVIGPHGNQARRVLGVENYLRINKLGIEVGASMIPLSSLR